MLQKYAQKDWVDFSADSFFLKLKHKPRVAFHIHLFKKAASYIRNMNFPSSPWKLGSGSHLASRKERARNGKEMVHLNVGRVEKDEGNSNTCNSVEDFKHFISA